VSISIRVLPGECTEINVTTYQARKAALIAFIYYICLNRRMRKCFYRKIAARLILAVFALYSVSAAAGAHYDIGYGQRAGDKTEQHSSRFHLSEFADYVFLQSSFHSQNGYTSATGCEQISCYRTHIHLVEKTNLHKHGAKIYITGQKESPGISLKPLGTSAPTSRFQPADSPGRFSARAPPASLI